MTLSMAINKIGEGQEIPVEYTCEGSNNSPEIKIMEIPSDTKSLALIVEDPDAPVGLFAHWVMFNISPNSRTIHERMEKSEVTEEGFIQGQNDFGNIGYDGPCPPKGHGYHRYFFRLYALKRSPELKGPVGRAELLKSMEGTILEESSVMGRYKR